MRCTSERDYFDEIKRNVAAARKQVEKQTHAIIAGPAVLPAEKDWRGQPQFSIFVAVARSDTQKWSGYLSDCVVHEFDEQGDPLAIVKLPTMVYGPEHHTVDGAVIWTCEDNSFVRILPPEDPHRMTGDKRCRIAWYRSLPTFDKPAWLRQGSVNDAIAFTGEYAFRTANGGFVETQKEQSYQFPIALVDLRTGLDRILLVRVPFEGTIPEPTQNFGKTTLQNGEHRWVKWSSYFLEMTELDVRGGALVVTFEAESKKLALEFDLADILKAN